MKVLVTGSNGFVGKNLISKLNLNKELQIYKFDKESTLEDLDNYTKDCDFVYHLAGVNRPKDSKEFMKCNYELTSYLLKSLKKNNNKCPVMLSSSIQAELDNDYGKSKKAGEELLFKYGKDNDVKVFVYRFPNLFGKWCKPNYNSVIATWCYNISHDIDIKVEDPSKRLNLAYIDDVCNELIKCLNNEKIKRGKYCVIPITYEKSLGEIYNLIWSFKNVDRRELIPTTGEEFIKDLYTTYISYVPLEKLVINLEEHRDDRGVFCELIRTKESGQVSVSTTNPNISRGGHYHNTKIERFIVIKGKAKIELEHIIEHNKYEFEVSGDKLQYVTIPAGYQHSINNIGDGELVAIFWASELFNKEMPDTYEMKVKV